MKRNLAFLASMIVLFNLVACNNASDSTATQASADANLPAIEVTAIKLLADYEADEPAAEKIYGGRNLVVSGRIMSIKPKHDGKVEILLNSPESSIGSVRCHFDVESAKALASYKREDNIVIKGVCANMDTHIQVVVTNAEVAPPTQPITVTPSEPVVRKKPNSNDSKVIDAVTDLSRPVEAFMSNTATLYVVIIDDNSSLETVLDSTQTILAKYKSPVRSIKMVDWNSIDSTDLVEPFGKVVAQRTW